MTTPRYHKTPWRGANTRFIQRVTQFSGQTLLAGGKVQSDIIDLAGSCPLDVLADYGPLLKSPRDLILAETDPATYLAAHASLEGLAPDTCPRVVDADVYDLVAGINRGTRRGYDKGPIGVISLDLTNNTGDAWWLNHGNHLFSHNVRPAIDRYGVCCVVLNHCLDHRCATAEERTSRLETHIKCLCNALSPFNGGRPVKRSVFLPDESEVAQFVEGGQSEGWLRNAQIYRSRVTRMVTLRIYLQARSYSVYSEKA